MDISSLEPSDLARMSEEQLEQALDVLRQGKAGKDAGRGGRPPSEKDPNRKIEGKCWNCGKEGHTAQACRQPKKPKGKGKKGRGRGVNSCDEDDDEEDDEEPAVGMLGLNSLDVDDDSDCVRVRGEWVKADPKDLDVCMFEGVEVSDSEDDDDDNEDADDECRDELTVAIEKQMASRRAIEKYVAQEEIDKSDEWKVPRIILKKSAEIRGTPLLEAYKNPFGNLVDKAVEVESSGESILDRHLRRLDAARSSSSTPSPSMPPSSVSPSSPCTLSSISPIRTTSHKAQEAEHHRLDTSVEVPPGLNGVMIKIDGMGGEPVYIAGKVINESNILASMPVSIASTRAQIEQIGRFQYPGHRWRTPSWARITRWRISSHCTLGQHRDPRLGRMLAGTKIEDCRRQEIRWNGENCRHSMSYKGAGPEE